MTRLRELGVVGTVVEDTIDRPGEETVRDMGGAYYAVLTLSALLPDDAVAVPIVAVGEDTIERVRADWSGLPRVSLEGVHPVPAVNNKVHIEYDAKGGREETLTGGVPALEWEHLEPWIDRLDAWCWNFVAGNEADLGTFGRVKRDRGGPLHLDVHSLCLGPPRAGRPREPRRPADWEAWIEGATWVQLNETEAGLLWGNHPGPLPRDREAELARRVHGLGAEGVVITRGERGASWLPREGARLDVAAHGPARDPTGCGDVLGAAWVALRAGHGLDGEAALRGAVRAGSAAARVRGTAGLAAALERADVLAEPIPGSEETGR